MFDCNLCIKSVPPFVNTDLVNTLWQTSPHSLLHLPRTNIAMFDRSCDMIKYDLLLYCPFRYSRRSIHLYRFIYRQEGMHAYRYL